MRRLLLLLSITFTMVCQIRGTKEQDTKSPSRLLRRILRDVICSNTLVCETCLCQHPPCCNMQCCVCKCPGYENCDSLCTEVPNDFQIEMPEQPYVPVTGEEATNPLIPFIGDDQISGNQMVSQGEQTLGQGGQGQMTEQGGEQEGGLGTGWENGGELKPVRQQKGSGEGLERKTSSQGEGMMFGGI